jgi:hypothetical protein
VRWALDPADPPDVERLTAAAQDALLALAAVGA